MGPFLRGFADELVKVGALSRSADGAIKETTSPPLADTRKPEDPYTEPPRPKGAAFGPQPTAAQRQAADAPKPTSSFGQYARDPDTGKLLNPPDTRKPADPYASKPTARRAPTAVKRPASPPPAQKGTTAKANDYPISGRSRVGDTRAKHEGEIRAWAAEQKSKPAAPRQTAKPFGPQPPPNSKPTSKPFGPQPRQAQTTGSGWLTSGNDVMQRLSKRIWGG